MELAWLIPALPFAAFAIVGLFTQRQHVLSSLLVIGATAASAAATVMMKIANSWPASRWSDST